MSKQKSLRSHGKSQRTRKQREAAEKNIGKYRWPKGVSGNPTGRPRKRPITELYAAFLDLKVEELPPRIRTKLKHCEGLTLGAAGVLGLFESWTKGSHSAAKEIREAVEGKSTQRIELTAEGGKPLKISHEHTVRGLKEAYGLSDGDDAETQTPDRPVPVSEAVDQRPQPEKDRPQE